MGKRNGGPSIRVSLRPTALDLATMPIDEDGLVRQRSIHHGAEPWSAPLAFDALFNIPDAVRPAIAPHLVRFTYLMDDLSEIPDDRLRPAR